MFVAILTSAEVDKMGFVNLQVSPKKWFLLEQGKAFFLFFL